MKTLIRRLVRRTGYDVVRWNPVQISHGYNAGYLATICRPRTVFDVGVGNGTPALYSAFPDARFILVEPLQEYGPAIEALEAAHDCRVYYCAVGRENGMMEMMVDLDDPEKSSFQARTALTDRGHATVYRTVEVKTLDAILEENPDLEPPILLKVDTEGYEIEALRGATRLLQQTELVIAEVSVAARFEGGYRFEDFIAFMRERGFRLLDVLALARPPGSPEAHHMDALFGRDAASTPGGDGRQPDL